MRRFQNGKYSGVETVFTTESHFSYEMDIESTQKEGLIQSNYNEPPPPVYLNEIGKYRIDLKINFDLL